MSGHDKNTSERLYVTPERQSVDVILCADVGPRTEEWQALLEAAIDRSCGDTLTVASKPKKLLAALSHLGNPCIVIDDQSRLVGDETLDLLAQVVPANAYVVVLIKDGNATTLEAIRSKVEVDDCRSNEPVCFRAEVILKSSRELIFLRNRLNTVDSRPSAEERLRRLNRVGLEFSRERDLTRLLNLVVRECMNQLNADAGSIFILESPTGHRSTNNRLLGRAKRQSSASALRITKDRVEASGWKLRFAAAMNDSVEIPFREFAFPCNEESIVGYAAIHGEVVNLHDTYDIPPDKPYRFNRSIDQQYHYRCVSLLTIPIRNMHDDVIGVVQVINKKHNPLQRLTNPKEVPNHVSSFTNDDVLLANSLGTQAGAALETVRLNDSIANLFESFVYASVRAIEQRDPSTAGHSARVDRLTLGIADLINRIDHGPFANIRFTDNEMVELHYASLLHDVGKIGVREHILTKANKLFPDQERTIIERAKVIELSMRERSLFAIRELLQARDTPDLDAKIRQMEEATAALVERVRSDLIFIREINKPGYLDPQKQQRLEEIRQCTYPVEEGLENCLLYENEYYSLKTVRGSLNPEEREEIESHVKKSRIFLDQIPWTDDLANVPIIAGQHHEKMNGKGYPDGVPAMETPLQARIMAVADVFDSLTSGDRPYKPAIPLERAIQIIESMRDHGELDPQVVNLFIEEQVWEKLNLKVLRMADANEEQRAAT